MKKLFYLLLLLPLAWHSCSDPEAIEFVTYKVNEPIFSDDMSFRSEIEVKDHGYIIRRPGKMCLIDDYLYIAERSEGIHILDNRNPAQAETVGFISIPGFNDFVVYDGRLYVDSYIDLVCFDFSAPGKPYEYNRSTGVLYEFLPETGNPYPIDYKLLNDRGDRLVVGWTLVTRTVELIGDDDYWKNLIENEDNWTEGDPEPVSPNTHLALYENTLYSIMGNKLTIIDMTRLRPELVEKDYPLVEGVTTIATCGNKLLMGSQSRTLVYSLENPYLPIYRSSISQIRDCNPIATDSDIIYTTTYKDNPAGQSRNELLAIDIQVMTSPQVIQEKTLIKPRGLAFSDGLLYVCDSGVRVFQTNTSDPTQPALEQVAQIKTPSAFNLFVFDRLLVVVSENGIYQYDCSDLENVIPYKQSGATN